MTKYGLIALKKMGTEHENDAPSQKQSDDVPWYWDEKETSDDWQRVGDGCWWHKVPGAE
jgi:hypothetical protein